MCCSDGDEGETHHDPCEQAHAFPTVRVRHHVPVADGEEGDGNEPHGPQEVTGHFLFVVIPEAAGEIEGGGERGEGGTHCQSNGSRTHRREHAGV